MPRYSIDPSIRSKTHTVSCRDREWEALTGLVFRLRLHTPFDVLRRLMKKSGDPEVRRAAREFDKPRSASDRTLKGRARAA